MLNMNLAAAVIVLGAGLGWQAAAQQTAPQQGTGGPPAGTTSGPAAGTNVESSAATQKKAGTPNSGAVSAGAPGAEAAKGSESGQKPK